MAFKAYKQRINFKRGIYICSFHKGIESAFRLEQLCLFQGVRYNVLPEFALTDVFKAYVDQCISFAWDMINYCLKLGTKWFGLKPCLRVVDPEDNGKKAEKAQNAD